MLQQPELPINFDVLVPLGTPDDERRRLTANPAAYRRETEEFYSKFLPNYLKDLKRVDIAALRRESDQAYDRVAAEFADVPGVPPYGKTTGEPLGELARKRHQPRPPIAPESRVKPLATRRSNGF